MLGAASLLSRRAALTASGAAVAVALVACRAGTPIAPAATVEPSPTADPDAELVRTAREGESQLRRDAFRTSRRHPGLRPALERTVQVHAAHTDLLRDSLQVAGAGPVTRRVPQDARAAARELARRERALAEAHARAALAARSGPLARVLAGMAAAADQQALVLDDLAGAVRRG